MRISDWSSDVCSSDLEVLRAVGYLARYKTWYDEDPAKLGANVRANYEQGLGMTLADFSRAHAEQTKAYRRVPAFFQERSEETRVGKGCVSRGWSWWAPLH